jgi:hypothetical protein
MTLEDIQARNMEIIASFAGIELGSKDGNKAIKEGLESIKHEA